MTKKILKSLIAYTMVAFVISTIAIKDVYAGCVSTYGGGEYCVYNKRFSIEKKVRVEGDDEWEDKITDVKASDVVQFRIKIENISDEDLGDFDDLKMKDILPNEMERTGGADLKEEWDDFEPGETKTFVIESKIDKDEFDREDSFEKCVVNKAEVYWDGEFEGADTATVCYGDTELTELPETGSELGIALGGLVMTFAGLILRKKLS